MISGNVGAAGVFGRADTHFRSSRPEELWRLAAVVIREIAVDEAVARAAAEVGNDATWAWRDDRTGASLHEPFDSEWLGDRDCQPSLYAAQPGGAGGYTYLLGADGDVPAAIGVHIATFDPAKVLAQCQTRRALVDALLAGADRAAAARALRVLAGADLPCDAVGPVTDTAPPLPEPDWLPYPQRVELTL